MGNTNYQIDPRNYYGGGRISVDGQPLRDMCFVVPKKEMCSLVQPQKEMCAIVPPKKDMCLIINKEKGIEKEEVRKEELLALDDNFYESLFRKLGNIDRFMNQLSNEESSTETKKDINTYTLMTMIIEKFPMVTRKKKIYIYNGRCFELSDINSVEQEILGHFREFVMGKSPDFIKNTVKFLFMEPNIAIKDEDIRSDLVSFDNVILDINTGKTYPHSPEFIVTYSIKASFMGVNCPECPMFDNFLYQITGGDLVLIERIWMMIGYILTPDIKAKSVFLLQGVGNSGKSALVKILQKLFNSSAVFPFDMDALSSTFGLGDLFGKAFCMCQDMPNKELNQKSVSVIKSLSGDDTVSSQVKYGESIVFDNRAKLILISNHAVRPKLNDDAFWDRLVIIPFKHSVSRENQNKNLIDELMRERDAIVTKSIFAYWKLKKNNYVFPGDYKPNEVIDVSMSVGESTSSSIYKFISKYFEAGSPEDYVLTQVAYELFIDKFFECNKYEFSQYYKECIFELFPNAEDIRKRRNGKGNPIHGVKGVRIKDFGV